MIIFIGSMLLFVLGIVLTCNSRNESTANSRNESTAIVGVILVIFSGIFLIICLVSLVTNPIEVRGDINKFLATKTTIEAARKTGIDIENTAVQHKIIESNQWLAKQQYFNSTIFELWIPDEVDKLKQIR
jgi:cell division protein FtsX